MHLDILQEKGYKFLTIADLWLAQRDLPVPWCVLSFDDGYEDNFSVVLDTLQRRGLRASFFVATGLVAGCPDIERTYRTLTSYSGRYMSLNLVRELAKAGMHVGAHSHTHRNLAHLPPEDIRTDILRSRSILEDTLGTSVLDFAYPFGKRKLHFDSPTVNIVREAGFRSASAIVCRTVRNIRPEHRYEFPRIPINASDSRDNFLRKIEGYFNWLGFLQAHLPASLKVVIAPEDRFE